MALKGTSEQLKEHFCSACRSAAPRCCGRTWKRWGPIKIKEVEAAQQQIIAIVRQLESEGAVSLKGTVGEQYVV